MFLGSSQKKLYWYLHCDYAFVHVRIVHLQKKRLHHKLPQKL